RETPPGKPVASLVLQEPTLLGSNQRDDRLRASVALRVKEPAVRVNSRSGLEHGDSKEDNKALASD
ncbi:MAG: hypothetical protein ACRD6N_03770, partial [Pyrinomonadaceae bacterium]